MKPSFAQKNAHTEDYCHNPPNKILQLSRLTSSSRIAIVLASGDVRLFVQTDVWCPNKSTQRIFGSFNTYNSIARNDTTFLTHSDMFADLLVFSWYQICEFLSSLFFSLSWIRIPDGDECATFRIKLSPPCHPNVSQVAEISNHFQGAWIKIGRS